MLLDSSPSIYIQSTLTLRRCNGGTGPDRSFLNISSTFELIRNPNMTTPSLFQGIEPTPPQSLTLWVKFIVHKENKQTPPSHSFSLLTNGAVCGYFPSLGVMS